MKILPLLVTAGLGLAVWQSNLLAQAESSSTGTGGATGNTGTGSQSTGAASHGSIGTSDGVGGTGAASTNAPSSEFHPPPTSAAH